MLAVVRIKTKKDAKTPKSILIDSKAIEFILRVINVQPNMHYDEKCMINKIFEIYM